MESEKLLHLTDEEILLGFKQGRAEVVKEYFYGYCRVAYGVYAKRYELQNKPGMDFFSLAHEYYLYLWKHDFKPLEDRNPSVTLKTWMVNGFRFLVLDKLKAVQREHLFESFEVCRESPSRQLDVVDGTFEGEFRAMIDDICHIYYRRDDKNAIILQMLFLDGFKAKEIAAQFGMSPSAVTQRYNKMMHDVVIPYFKTHFVASDYESQTLMPSGMRRLSIFKYCISREAFSGSSCSDKRKAAEKDVRQGRITPRWVETLAENEVFVFDSNLARQHGGGAARVARLRFGAVMGKGTGLQGYSYAIPTMRGGVETIRSYVYRFIAFAKRNPEKRFLVTPIGCGIAGFDPEDIAPLFKPAREVENICLPESFWPFVE